MKIFYLYYLAIVNLIAFALYGADKRRAKQRRWRIPEKTLLACSLFGGALGGLVGMQLFRHKTRHLYFYLVNIVGILFHVSIFVLLQRT